MPSFIVADSLKATRAMVFLGLFAIAGASIAFALKQFVLKEHDIVNKSAAGLFIFGGNWIVVFFFFLKDSTVRFFKAQF